MELVISDDLNKKLRVLSLITAVLVVFIHSHNEGTQIAAGELNNEQNHLVLYIENFVSKGVARIAVPFFFAISGLLFFKSFELKVQSVFEKLRKRFKSLFVPYLFWSVFGLILIASLQAIPWSRSFFTHELVANYSVSKLVITIFFDPVPYQLWFIRDLIMLTICSPLIWYLTKSTKGTWLVLLVVLWCAAAKTFFLFSNEALLFFSTGCALALDKRGLIYHKLSNATTWTLTVLWILVVLKTTSIITFEQSDPFLNILNNAGIVFGIMSVWGLYDHLNNERFSNFSGLLGYSFFIFVFHEPLLTIVKKGLFFSFGKTDLTSLVIYILAPMIAIGLSMIMRNILRKGTPRLYNFATGGR